MNVMPTVPVQFQDHDLVFTIAVAGQDAELFKVVSFDAQETLFGLYNINVELISFNPAVDLHAVMDSPATITIHHRYEGERHLSGIVTEVERGNRGHHRTAYSLTIRPMLHRLDHGSDCRIFQKKTVPDIIKILLKEYGVEDVRWIETQPHELREYCVQYRETHLEFIQRLAAEEGIFFYFQHGKNGQHTLVFCDNWMVIADLEHASVLTYNPSKGGNVKGPYVSSFTFRERLRSTKWVQRDYSFKNPAYNQQHEHVAQETNGTAKDYAMYDYPGRYKKKAAGTPFTKNLMQATRVDASTGHGVTDNIFLCPGYKTELEGHDDPSLNIKYLLLGVTHSGEQPTALEEDGDGGRGTFYEARFSCMPARLPYSPPQKTHPVIDGPQIAHVVGPEGEEIYTDEFGRVKVHFQWDRYSGRNEHSSCWVRMTSQWGGGKWGHISLPRIGQEVLVDFLEGDPDQPIITARAYHAVNQVPYDLPKHKTRMTIKSQTHKGNGYNELRFEDEFGREEMFIRAQKDQNIHVQDSRMKRVENNQTETVGVNKNTHVGAHHSEQVKGNQIQSIGNGLTGLLGPLMAITTQQLQKAASDVESGKGNHNMSALGPQMMSGLMQGFSGLMQGMIGGGGFGSGNVNVATASPFTPDGGVMGATGSENMAGFFGGGQNIEGALKSMATSMIGQGAQQALASIGDRSGGEGGNTAPAAAVAATVIDRSSSQNENGSGGQSAIPARKTTSFTADGQFAARAADRDGPSGASSQRGIWSKDVQQSNEESPRYEQSVKLDNASLSRPAIARTPDQASVASPQDKPEEVMHRVAAAMVPVASGFAPGVIGQLTGGLIKDVDGLRSVAGAGGVRMAARMLGKTSDAMNVSDAGKSFVAQMDSARTPGFNPAAAGIGAPSGGGLGQQIANQAMSMGTQLVQSLLGGGMQNVQIEKIKNEAVGAVASQQVGATKTTAVGHTYAINVGNRFEIICGKSKFVMKEDGTVLFFGTNFNFTATGPVQVNGKVIDLN